MNTSNFNVPESLSAFVDDNLRDAHDDLSRKSLEEFWSDMPLSQAFSDTTETAYVDLRPEQEHDSNKVVVLPLPFANGWAPHMALRAALLQRSMAEPRRMIILPNDRNSYHLSSEERSYISNGNFEPLAAKHLQTLQRLEVDEVSYIGYSQGAALGASALRLAALRDQFTFKPSGLFEPPNVVRRSPLELQKQFIASGKGLDKAVNDSGIPALSEAQHSRGGFDVFRKNIGLLPFVLKTQSANNRAIHKGFAHPHFTNDISAALKRNSELRLYLASAEESTITPPEVTKNLSSAVSKSSQSRIATRIIEGYGHEMGDNIVVHAIIGNLALNND